MKELIHFAHGNGLPSLCYSQLLQQLGKRYDYFYLERIGHNPKFPVTENWEYLVKEILANIQRKKKPVIAVGHSLGGILSLLASFAQPKLFKAVIMIDSPVLRPLKSNIVRFAKAMGMIDQITPASRTRNRRTHWKNKEQVLQYLKKRDLFKTFAPECLQDYIDYGLNKTNAGYELHFDRHIEYLIFRTIPHTLPEYKGPVPVPTVLIYGDRSTVVKKRDVQYMQKHYNIVGIPMPGTHMLPLESPVAVANQICTILDNLQASSYLSHT